MRNKKRILSILLVIFMVFSSGVMVSANNDYNKTATIKGRTTQTLVIPVYGNVVPTDEEKTLLIKGGWKYNDKGFYKVYPNKLGTIKYNNEEVVVDDDGYFKIVTNGEFKEDLLDVQGYDKNQFRIDTKNIKSNDNLIVLDTQIDFNEFAMNHITPEEMAIQSENEINPDMIVYYDPGNPRNGGYVGEHLIPDGDHSDATYGIKSYITCNRFNGYLGDQTYYNKSAHVFASGVNFTQSDCDVSIGSYGAPCLNTNGGDYDTDPTKRFCTSWTVDINSSATCSERTGHMPLFHKHTSFFGPTGF